jgi:hypothetical protein
MPIAPIKDLAKIGVVADQPSLLLPPNAFSNALNVRFRNGRIVGLPGDEARLTVSASISNALDALFWPRTDGQVIMVAKADGHIWALTPKPSGGTTTGEQFTAADFTSDLAATYPSGGYLGATTTWQGGLFGGGRAVYFNDGVHVPLYCLLDETATDTKFRQFPGWNYGSNSVSAQVVKTFGYSLVAGNLTINDGVNITYAPVTVRVSVPAPVGSFPQVWEPGDTAILADEFELSSKTPITDMAELRGNLFIYCLDSIHTLSTNNSFVQAQSYAQDHGILNKNCVVEFENKHLVVDANDIYIHNGSGNFESIVEGKARDFFLEDVDRAHIGKTHVTINRRYKEVWINYRSRRFAPAYGADGCTLAMVWNYKDNTLTFRELPCARLCFTGNQFIRTGTSGAMVAAFIPGTEVLFGMCNNAYLVEYDGGDGREESISSVVAHQTLRMFAVNVVSSAVYRGYYQWVVKNRLMVGEEPSTAKTIQGFYMMPDNTSNYRIKLASQNVYPPLAGIEPIYDDADFTGTGVTFVPLGRELVVDAGNDNSVEVTFTPTYASLDGGVATHGQYLQKLRTNGRFFSFGVQCMSSTDGLMSLPFMAIELKEESKR